MEVRRTLTKEPFFSVCIPQYNRTSFILESCKSLAQQTFKNFEVCISDDCSTDGRENELLYFLNKSGLSFVYRKQEENRRYDGNLRTAIGLARGKFCFLLGNDDALASPATLEELFSDIQKAGAVGVMISNYADFATGQLFRRIKQTGLLGSGPEVAVKHYRNFSFVSGVALETIRAKAHATATWDRSEMYQMFIGCRIIAEGHLLLGVERVTIRKDIQIPRAQVDSYALKPRLTPCPIVERRLPLVDMGRLVADAVAPYVLENTKQKTFEWILQQLVLFPYLYWIVEYRRVQSWKYAIGICLGMRLKNSARGLELHLLRKLRLTLVYWIATVAGLCIPVSLFEKIASPLRSFAKSRYAALLVRLTSN